MCICKGFPHYKTLLSYHTNQFIPLSSQLSIFSIDFTGSLPPSRNWNRYILVCVEHLNFIRVEIATRTTTADVVISFLIKDVLRPFGPPSTIVSDNSTYFTSRVVTDVMKKWKTDWKTVLAYAPMSNGLEERMVGNIQRGLKKMVIEDDRDLEEALLDVLMFHRVSFVAHWELVPPNSNSSTE